MEKSNMADFLVNLSTPPTDVGQSVVTINPTNTATAIIMAASFLVGIVMNGLCLWVLAVKMRRTVNTLWFFHLILTYTGCSGYMPLLLAYFLLDSHWIFGMAMCKIVNFLASLGMFASVFLLMIISLDRYLLTCHPIWSQHNRTIPQAKKLLLGMWLVALALSAPYLIFRETREIQKGKISCVNNYALSGNWEGDEVQALRNHIHLAFFLVRFLLAFLLPFFTIMGCSFWMGQEMKKRRLVRRTRKPIRILMASVASFFISWLPYHLFQASLLVGASNVIVRVLKMTSFIGVCFNFCFTPVLYIFVGEKFQQVFKTTLLVVLQKGFMDDDIVAVNDLDMVDEGH